MSIEAKNILGGLFPEEFEIRPMSGGDINEAYHCKSDKHDLAVKINSRHRFPEMFVKEAKGLEIIANTNTIKSPKVYTTGDMNEEQFIVMDFIDGGLKSNTFWENFGSQLAELHRTPAKYYGLDHDNYIGSLKQSNTRSERWDDFLVEQRFKPMLKMALDHNTITSEEVQQFEKIYSRINEFWPSEIPVVIHGDLWSGNYVVGSEDQPYLIDPAVYHGHREMDIGMMHLFGGFDNRLFEAYNETNPLKEGWRERIPYNQLYPLLVHVNLFGRSYWNSIERIIERL